MFIGSTDDSAALARQWLNAAPERGIEGQPTRFSYSFQTAPQGIFQT
jgi:hypothetical protein